MIQRLIIALDFYSWGEACTFAENYLDPKKHIVKIGHKLIYGHKTTLSAGIPRLIHLGFKVFLDTKLHEIPSIVGETVESIVNANVIPWAITIHASGGDEMMSAAIKHSKDMHILGVTKLTTSNATDSEIQELGNAAYNQHTNGIICSPKDLHLFADKPFMKITPGIRLDDQKIENDDQVRTDNAYNAICNGATHIVVGRPITKAKNPPLMLHEIEDQIDLALQHSKV